MFPEERRTTRNHQKYCTQYWASLNQIIRDALADFVYQGFTKGPKPMVAGMTNNIDNLIKYIEEAPEINQHEPGRRRAKYLEYNRQN